MKKPKKAKLLEDGSLASTGHKPKTHSAPLSLNVDKLITVSESIRDRVELERECEKYAFRIRNETRKLAALTDEITKAYSMYAESNEKIDSSPSLHNGLGNMMKLIEVQTATKLRIKRIQTAILETIVEHTDNDELPYAVQDIIREINVNFLDSKLIRAYGDIAKIMKEDLEIAKVSSKEILFSNGDLTSELESLPTIKTDNVTKGDDEYEEDEE